MCILRDLPTFQPTVTKQPETGNYSFQKRDLSCKKSHIGLNLLLTQVKTAFAKTCQHGIPVT